MRIALVPTPDLTLQSGSALYARNQAETLAAQGVEVHVLARGAQPPLEHAVAHDLPIPLPHPIEEDVSVDDAAFDASVRVLLEALCDLHEDHPFDLVHGLYSTFTGYAACLFGGRTGVPSIVSCFGRDVNPGLVGHPAGRRLSARCLELAGTLVASNDRTRSEILRRLPRPREVFVLGMGVPEWRFDPRRLDRQRARRALGCNDDEPIVLAVVSAMLPDKQLDRVVEAMIPVLEDRRHGRLVVVGPEYDGGTGVVERIRDRIARTSAGNRILLTGLQDQEIVATHLAAADVLVDARSCANFSSSLMEGVAMGRAVVVSASAAEQLGPERGVFPSFPDGDTTALRNRLKDLLDSPTLREQTASASRAWWDRHRDSFGLEASTRRLVELYCKVLTTPVIRAGEFLERRVRR